MQMQMTERDKKLIVFLAIFVLVVGLGYWGVYPIISAIVSTNMEMESAQEEQLLNERKIAQLSLVEIENEKLEEEIVSAREKFFPMMSSDQVDKYMTELILGHNLYAYDLNIKMPEEEAETTPYQYSERAAKMEEDDTASGSSGESVQEGSETDAKEDAELAAAQWNSMEDVSTGIYAVSVTMRIGGENADIQKLIDELSASEKTIRLLSYKWDSERSVDYHDDGTYEILTNRILNMTLELYMCQE